MFSAVPAPEFARDLSCNHADFLKESGFVQGGIGSMWRPDSVDPRRGHPGLDPRITGIAEPARHATTGGSEPSARAAAIGRPVDARGRRGGTGGRSRRPFDQDLDVERPRPTVRDIRERCAAHVGSFRARRARCVRSQFEYPRGGTRSPPALDRATRHAITRPQRDHADPPRGPRAPPKLEIHNHSQLRAWHAQQVMTCHICQSASLHPLRVRCVSNA
jgi:hypothetical protein